MKRIDISCVKKWVAAGRSQLAQPASIGITCPSCSMRGAFATKRRYYDEHRDTLSCSADCPACSLVVHFWVTDLVEQASKDPDKQPSLYMSPATEERLDLETLPETVPEKLREYCSSAQDVYFSGNLTATNVLALSALKALFNANFADDDPERTLSGMVTDSIPALKLDQPLKDIAELLEPDGHLADLFESSQYTSQETADAIMYLIEHLITYIYVMPEKFKHLESLFAELNRTTNLARKGLTSRDDPQGEINRAA